MVLVNVISTCLFFTNLLAVLVKKEKIHTILCSALLITSFLFHSSNRNIILMRIDETVVGMALVYATYCVLRKNIWSEKNLVATLVWIISATIGIIIFVYGYFTDSFCYHPEFGNWYHALMHGFGSLAHHCTILIS